MLTEAAEASAINPYAVEDRTMETPSLEGLDTKVSARSTILICIVCPGLQNLGTAALMHLTKYCLPQAAPLSHTPYRGPQIGCWRGAATDHYRNMQWLHSESKSLKTWNFD
ncbi:hypothetical protein SLE2022_270730 [Rubroshorea leprosula]